MPRRQSLRDSAMEILSAGLRAVDPGRLVSGRVRRAADILFIDRRRFSLAPPRRVYVAAMGKAACPMARRLASILGGRLTRGVVLVPPGSTFAHPRLEALPASHPFPDARSLRAARAILALARGAGPDDLFLVLISGGASAQVSLPLPGLKLAEKRAVTDRLLRAGADIFELNAVRKHLSAIKGGRLARAAYPATVVNLVLSDVRHDDLGTIASGPTHWDTSTYERARGVLEKYGLWRNAAPGVKRVIGRGLRGEIEETLKPGSVVFQKVRSSIIGDVRTALRAAAAEAVRLGFETRTIAVWDHGEAREVAGRYARRLKAAARKDRRNDPLCFLAGGELSVTVRGSGRGGRNTEFALAAMIELAKEPWARIPAGPALDWLAASLGTDGVDGPTDAAGAWAGPRIVSRAAKMRLDPAAFLERNDSYSFLRRTRSLIHTGPTGTNVMDLRLFLLGRA
jgi:glycerate 2-kinase